MGITCGSAISISEWTELKSVIFFIFFSWGLIEISSRVIVPLQSDTEFTSPLQKTKWDCNNAEMSAQSILFSFRGQLVDMQAAARTSHPIPSVFISSWRRIHILRKCVVYKHIDTQAHCPARTNTHQPPTSVRVYSRGCTCVGVCACSRFVCHGCLCFCVCVCLCVHMSVGCTRAILPSCRRSTTLFNGPLLSAHTQREPKQKGGREISRSCSPEPHETGNFLLFFLLYKQKKTRSQFALM